MAAILFALAAIVVTIVASLIAAHVPSRQRNER